MTGLNTVEPEGVFPNPEPDLPLAGPNAQEAANYLGNVRGLASWPKNQKLPQIYRAMAAARAQGHEWDEINGAIAQKKQDALKAGYSEDDINHALLGLPLNGYVNAPPITNNMNLPDKAGALLRQFSESAFGPENAFDKLNLPPPAGAVDYTAGGILKHLGWTLGDALKTLPGSFVNGLAATAEMLDGKQRSAWEWGKQLYEASGFLMPFLAASKSGFAKMAGARNMPEAPRGMPQMNDFIDAATAIANKHPDGLTEATLAQTLKAVGEHYVATGEHPIDTAASVKTYDDFRNKFTADGLPRPVGPREPTPDERLAASMAAEDRVVPPDNTEAQPVKPTTFEEATKGPDGRINVEPDAVIDPETIFQKAPVTFNRLWYELKSFFSPASLAPNAAEAIRYRLAQSTVETEKAMGALQRFGRAVGELSTPERWGLIDAIESGDTAHPNYPNQGTPLRGLMDELRTQLDKAYQAMQKAGVAPDYVENYLPHIYANPQQVRPWLQTRSPIAGGKSFTRGRIFGSYAEAREAGFVGATDNPIHMATLALRQMNKYIAAHRIVADFRNAEIIASVKPGDAAPGDFERINGRLGVTGEGDLYAPRDVARLINNITDPGLANYAWYRVVRTMSNDLIRMQLAGPGYHSTFVTLDTISSQMALAAKQISRGLMNAPTFNTLGEVIRAPITAITSPLAPIKNFLAGRQIINYLRGNLPEDKVTPLVKQIGEAFVQGGGRTGITADYRGSAYGSFLQSFKGTLVPSSGYATVGQEIAQTFRDATAGQKPGMKYSWGIAKTAYQLLGRTMETISAPLMEYYVPTMKAGTFSMLMQDALRVYPEMGELEMRHVASKINDSMDNRLGEMVYDNTFWNKTHKDLAHIAVRALGWNAGDIREMPGGVADLVTGKTQKIGDIRSITDRASYTVGLPVTIALAGAVAGVAMGTWHKNWTMRDYFNPPTPSGSRIVLPSYMKDIENVFHDPEKVATSKLNPFFPAIHQMLTNRDWYGAVIADTHGEDTGTNIEDYATWFARQYAPISLQQAFDPTQEQSTIPPALRLLGIQPAPYAERQPERVERAESKEYKQAVKKREKERAR